MHHSHFSGSGWCENRQEGSHWFQWLSPPRMALWGLCAASSLLSLTLPSVSHSPGPGSRWATGFHFPWMYIGPGGKSLTEVPETRERTSRDTDLPVSDWPTSPMCSKAPASQKESKNLLFELSRKWDSIIKWQQKAEWQGETWTTTKISSPDKCTQTHIFRGLREKSMLLCMFDSPKE